MKKIITILFIPLFYLLNLTANAEDLRVGQNEKFLSVKEAVKQAKDGDKIIVNKGTYKESNIVITKKIELIGQDSPVIDGDNNGEIITVKSDNVKISGFNIQNAGFSNLHEYSGIRIENVRECTVENNAFFNAPYGIYLANVKKTVIKGNKVKGLVKSEVSYGNAIHIWKSNEITVNNNELTGHRDGIYFEFVKDSHIENNNSYNNLRYGLHFMFSDRNVYKSNTFSKNGAGVAVMYTNNIEMVNNRFENNWGPAAYGLLLKEIRKSNIQGNIFTRNTMGIYLDGGNNLDLNKNTFLNNGYALKVIGNSYDNKIRGNNFIANSFDVTTNSSGENNNNVFMSNYWDKYQGYDLNKDNIGDVPFRPVSLFSVIIEKIPYSVLLLRSFFVSLLDVSEKVLPIFTPKFLIDDKPLMKVNRD